MLREKALELILEKTKLLNKINENVIFFGMK
jgi:hypothetical protein